MPLLTVSIEQQLPSFAALTKYHVQVVQADRAQQAAAYAAVNEITKTTPQKLFHARLAAGIRTRENSQMFALLAGLRLLGET